MNAVARRLGMNTTPRRLSFGFDRFSGLYLLALFILIFGLWVPDTFLTTGTAQSVATGQALIAMVGLAVLIPLCAGHYDLSVGATANLSTIIVTILQVNEGWAIGPAIVVAILAGTAVGLINAFLVVRLHMSSFIATLGMATVIVAVQSIVSGQSQPAPVNSITWNEITQTQVLGLQLVFWYLMIIAFLLWWFLEHTPAGRYIHAVGGNAEAARLSGVRVGMWSALTLVMSGTLCGIVGVFYGSFVGPSLTFGGALLLPAFAAAFLGSTQLKPGRFNVWGAVLAVYVLATGIKGMQLVTGVQWLNDMFYGTALIVAVAFAVWRQRAAEAAGIPRRSRGGEPQSSPPDTPDTDTARATA